VRISQVEPRKRWQLSVRGEQTSPVQGTFALAGCDQFNRDPKDAVEKIIPGHSHTRGKLTEAATKSIEDLFFFGGVRRGARRDGKRPRGTALPAGPS
jgi:hypothetical protein